MRRKKPMERPTANGGLVRRRNRVNALCKRVKRLPRNQLALIIAVEHSYRIQVHGRQKYSCRCGHIDTALGVETRTVPGSAAPR
jgi:hypothetical protein